LPIIDFYSLEYIRLRHHKKYQHKPYLYLLGSVDEMLAVNSLQRIQYLEESKQTISYKNYLFILGNLVKKPLNIIFNIKFI